MARMSPVGSGMIRHISFCTTNEPRSTGLVVFETVEPAMTPPCDRSPMRLRGSSATFWNAEPVTPVIP